MSKFEENMDNKLAAPPISNELSILDETDFLVSSDSYSLYPSATAHLDSKWPKKDTAKAMNQNDSKWPCSIFNFKTWNYLTKSGFFKVK